MMPWWWYRVLIVDTCHISTLSDLWQLLALRVWQKEEEKCWQHFWELFLGSNFGRGLHLKEFVAFEGRQYVMIQRAIFIESQLDEISSTCCYNVRNVSSTFTSGQQVLLVVEDVVLWEIVSREVLLVSQNHFANAAFSVALVVPEKNSLESVYLFYA